VSGDGLNPKVISASRLDKLFNCGLAFKWHYVDHLPGEVYGAAALFGSVMHKALERWSLNRQQDLPQLVESAWLEITEGTTVRKFLGLFAPLFLDAEKVVDGIRERRPEIKNPRMTKDFKESAVAKEIRRLTAAWATRLDEGSQWRFSKSDPLPALYAESFTLAKAYATRSSHYPTSLVTEFAFDVEWHGFFLRGYIDSIEPLVTRDGELVGLAVVDYKSEGKVPSKMKHWRQLCTYDVAVRELLSDGRLVLPDTYAKLPIFPGIDWLRWQEGWEPHPPRQFYSFGTLDHERLLNEIKLYERTVEDDLYLPASKFVNAEMCEFGDLCCLKSCHLAGGECIPLEVAL
jgi:hypothetical protein